MYNRCFFQWTQEMNQGFWPILFRLGIWLSYFFRGIWANLQITLLSWRKFAPRYFIKDDLWGKDLACKKKISWGFLVYHSANNIITVCKGFLNFLCQYEASCRFREGYGKRPSWIIIAFYCLMSIWLTNMTNMKWMDGMDRRDRWDRLDARIVSMGLR